MNLNIIKIFLLAKMTVFVVLCYTTILKPPPPKKKKKDLTLYGRLFVFKVNIFVFPLSFSVHVLILIFSLAFHLQINRQINVKCVAEVSCEPVITADW